MNYGLSLNEEEKGKMGFGVINSNKEPLVFFYSNGTSIYPNMIQDDVFLNKGISAWDDGINDKITLKYGEERILAVYRQNENTMPSGYDYQDAEAIKEIIKDSETVLFFKIKIEKAQ